MTSEGLYNTLLQFKNAGWFKHAKAIVIGKVCFPNTFTGLTYEEVIKNALGDVKCIFNFDIGHVKPSFTMINGMKAKVVSNKDEGYLEFIN
jgi:muramoyltetrapeptide carboxypeptidase LdcA involved in peptidoglycan recycling